MKARNNVGNRFVQDQINQCARKFSLGKNKEGLNIIYKLLLQFRCFSSDAQEGATVSFVSNNRISSKSKCKIKRAVDLSILKNNDMPQSHLNLAIYFARSGKVEQALQKYSDIHLQFPDFYKAYSHLLEYLRRWKERQAVLSQEKEVVALNIESAPVSEEVMGKPCSPAIHQAPFSLFYYASDGILFGSQQRPARNSHTEVVVTQYYSLFK